MKIKFTKDEIVSIIKIYISDIFPGYEIKGDELNSYGDSDRIT